MARRIIEIENNQLKIGHNEKQNFEFLQSEKSFEAKIITLEKMSKEKDEKIELKVEQNSLLEGKLKKAELLNSQKL